MIKPLIEIRKGKVRVPDGQGAYEWNIADGYLEFVGYVPNPETTGRLRRVSERDYSILALYGQDCVLYDGSFVRPPSHALLEDRAFAVLEDIGILIKKFGD